MDAIKAFISPPGTRGGAHKQLQESTGGAQAARTWRGRILAPEIPPSDSAACAYATMCPCLALGENYQRAFSLPKWTIVAHALLWFFGMTALWITNAAINGQCARMTKLSYPFPPPGVRVIDLETLRATNYTRGAAGSGSVNFTAIFANRTATAAYAAQVERARGSILQLAACEARLSPTLGGVFIITLATLLYGFWRRTQIRRLFGLPGDTVGDLGAWLFCACCSLCQEYRTLRLANVEFGQWGGNVGWLLDGDATVAKPPPDIEMQAGGQQGGGAPGM